MKKTTKVGTISHKLKIYNQPYVTNNILKTLIEKNAPAYTIAELCKDGIVTPIKRWKIYINNRSSHRKDDYVIGSLYFGDEPYVFGGLHVYNLYHFTTQIAERYTIYNTTISGKKIIGNAKFIFKKVRPSFFYGIKTKMITGRLVNFMSPERALIELYKEKENPEFIKGIPSNIDRIKLTKMAEKYCDKNVLQRIKKI